jgi:hypothetical protein
MASKKQHLAAGEKANHLLQAKTVRIQARESETRPTLRRAHAWAALEELDATTQRASERVTLELTF